MTITRNNCEAAFLDYYEQTLSPVEVAEVLFFLEENPDLKETFESYNAIFLEHNKVDFPDKDSLKRPHRHAEIETVLSSEINKTNYEPFFVAGAEGILSETQIQKLHLFLAQHPELKKEYELFSKCKLTADPISFDNKDLLKKEVISAGNREEYFVRAVEKDLSPAEQKQLASFLKKNPSFRNELEAFRQTILAPENIPFEFKEQLKRKERKPVFVSIFSQRTAYYAAAAAVLLLAGLFFFFRSSDNNATYTANNTGPVINTAKVENVNPAQANNTAPAIKEIMASEEKEQLHAKNNQTTTSLQKFANKIQTTPLVPAEEQEKIIPQPVLSENKMEENPIANKPAEKQPEKIKDQAIANNTGIKTDSAKAATPQNEATASAMIPKNNPEEYQTVASIVNKKIRSALGIKKSTECETSDKIGLWDLAMVAKKGVQKIIGAKALDVNKVCEGAEGKVEYVFTAGNFEISKNASR